MPEHSFEICTHEEQFFSPPNSNISFGLKNNNSESGKERVAYLSNLFQLDSLNKRYPWELSGGEQQRDALARALATDPAMLLLDEPFAGVDLLSIQDIKGLLLKLQARGCAVLVTDHNASQLLSVVDRAYVIANGSIVANGTPRQIVNTAEAKKLYFGEDFKINN